MQGACTKERRGKSRKSNNNGSTLPGWELVVAWRQRASQPRASTLEQAVVEVEGIFPIHPLCDDEIDDIEDVLDREGLVVDCR